MDFKSLLAQLDKLNEAVKKTKTGIEHHAEPGGYGRKDDEDDEGKKVKSDAPKKGKGRPKKDADASGETKKYDFSAFGVKAGKDVKLPKYDKKKTTTVKGKSQSHASNKVDDGTDPGEEPKTKKKGLKEYFDSLDRALLEAEQIQIKPASQVPSMAGKTSVGQKPAVPGQQPQQGQQQGQQQNTQVIQQGNKVLGTVNNQNLAQQIKQSIGKGEMTLMPEEEMHEDGEKWIQGAIKHPGAFKAKAEKAGMSTAAFAKKHAHDSGTLGKQARLAQTLGKMHKESVAETDMPPNDSLASPMTYNESKRAKAEKAGKKVTKDIEYDEKKTVKEAAKPDFLDLDKDGNKKESMKKAATDKKKVKEGMDQRLNAARSEGKAHGLRGHAHCGKNYEDMEEARCYHEGYKEGLDECYGQMPIQGLVGETSPEVQDMASYGARTPELDEVSRGEYMKQTAIKTPGKTFKAFGQTMHDDEVLESPFAFEAWEKELNAILEGKEVTEGMTVSISKGQQGMPDSVSVNAQDAEADQLLSIIKQAGLGLFGGDDAPGQAQPQPMTVDNGGEPDEVGAAGAEIDVVDDHDGMMALMKKLSGTDNGDYADEEGSDEGHEHTDEEACNECGMAYESCGCDHADGKEVVDEVESEDQETEEVAEETTMSGNGDNDEEQSEVGSDATRDAALAQAAGQNFADTDAPVREGAGGPEASEEPVVPETHAGDTAEDGNDAPIEDELDESYANGADDTFEADIDFMTKVISGGLDKEKIDVAGNGQSTIPAVATTRPMKESTDLLSDWRKLSGIK